MVSRFTSIEQHPDIAELRMRYDRVAQTPVAQVIDGLGFLAGLYVAASPWIAGFNGFATLTVNNVITGFAMALLALGFASAYGRTHGIAWVAPLLGVWTIVAPWAVSGNVDTTRTITSNVIVGGLYLLFSLAAVGLGMMRRRSP